MPDIYQIAEQHRRQLLARDEAARARIAASYEQTRARLEQLAAEVAQRIATAKENGETISRAWLYRQERYKALIAQVEREIDQWTRQIVAPMVEFGQGQAASLATIHARDLIIESQPLDVTLNIRRSAFGRLPVGAIENLVGFTAGGSPLSALLNGYGATSADLVTQALIANLASGRGPRVAAREIAKILDQPRWQAERLARTEMLRSYRETTLENYKANGIGQWEWLCSRSPRTCAACLSQDGELFPATTPMASHPNCRCVPIPVIGNRRTRQTGAEWFALQSDELQNNTLGKANAELYRSGEAGLADFVALKRSEKWGDSYVQTGFNR
jgi:SPP1 gp7 family putative phage head morphogenesis protein